MPKEEMYFDVDYKGWLNRRGRMFADVALLFSNKGKKEFAGWAESSLYGDSTIIEGKRVVRCVPSFEIDRRCRYHISLPNPVRGL